MNIWERKWGGVRKEEKSEPRLIRGKGTEGRGEQRKEQANELNLWQLSCPP